MLPVCDHYSGVEVRMRKSLELQASLTQELGAVVFDVTLDGEDGAPVGGELDHAELIASLVNSPLNAHGRVGARVHPVRHPAFEAEVDALMRRAGPRLAYLMVPKPESLADVQRACDFIDHTARACGLGREVPVHALIETHGALRDVVAIAAHPRIESISFGLMDFVSEHRGAIPSSAMGVAGQFEHPLVLRAKVEIAAAAHAHGKTPSHCVVTEFNDAQALGRAARTACQSLAYTRMWSIHPNQIRPIVEAFSPDADEVSLGGEVLLAAQQADWGPVRHKTRGQDTLHDRASYRYFWHVLERAHATGRLQDAVVRTAFFGARP
jgi:citrate lyase subunit beta / citryl-CoA lyase